MSDSPWSIAGTRTNHINLLRFILASIVIFSHSYPLLYGEREGNVIEPLMIITRQQMTGGRLAVDAFFILSGFLITQSWLSSTGFIDFLWKRVLRIYPAYVVMSIICAVVVKPLGGAPLPHIEQVSELPRWFMYQLLLYLPSDRQAFQQNPLPYAINGSVWTIKYEFWCYILLGILGIIGILRRRRLMVALFGVSLCLHTLQVSGIIADRLPFENNRTWMIFGELSYYCSFMCFFLAGAVFCLYRERIPYSFLLFITASSVLAVLTLCGWGMEVALPVFGAYTIFYLGFLRTSTTHQGKFVTHADISYGTYLYAYPVQQLLVDGFAASLQPLALSVIALFITFVLAMFSWNIIERPSLRMKHVPITRLVSLGIKDSWVRKGPSIH